MGVAPLRREPARRIDPLGEDRLVDRGYEGDSGYLAHLGSAADTGRWDAVDRAGGDDAAVGVARRLQARLDRHIWLLERLHTEQLYPEPPGLPELYDTALRMRRDTESLLLLAGHEPGAGSAGPRRLGDLAADAAALAEEPSRVDVRSAPAVLVEPAAAVEFVHVLAELVDHVTAVYPGARIELVTRVEPGNRGATVDAFVNGAARHDPDGFGGRRAAAAAEQLAHRSRHGVTLRRPPSGPPPTGSGLVASVHCPPAVVTVEEPPLPPPRPVVDRTGLSSLSAYEFGFDAGGLNGHAASGTNGSSSLVPGPVAEPSNGNGNGIGNGRPPLSFDDAPTYSPSSSSQVDELFGPLLDLPLEPIDDRYATPIFEAIASAWFREDEAGGGQGGAGPLDWQTPQDDEWREAAARAARPEPELPTTSSGLPRRRPGNQLVPPPRTTEHNGTNGSQQATPAERAPDRVRDRLSTYQRGLREGRHRAPGSEGGAEPEDW
jgi:hypothetical protein